MIFFDKEKNLFYLETDKTSYIIELLDNGMLKHVYYGNKIPREDMSFYNLIYGRTFLPEITVGEKKVSPDVFPFEYPTSGRGDYRTPALVVECADGRTVNEILYTSHRIIDGRPEIKDMPYLDTNIDDVKTLEICLTDKVAGFEIFIYYTVFEKENVISRYATVHNISDKALTIKSIASASLNIESSELEFLTLEGEWGRERNIQKVPVIHGTCSVESRRGSSSHALNPFAALASKNADEHKGDVYGAALIYSADFKITAEAGHFGNTRFQIGINPETFSWELLPDAAFTTPEAMLTFSSEGFNGMSQNFHNASRNHLGKLADKSIKHPILINCWEACYFDINDDVVIKFIDNCAGLGFDTFVMDDGWFGHRDLDNSSLGDWFVYNKKFPNGLHGVIDACHRNGMNFGLWFEPEMISYDSELYKAHPDWLIKMDGREPISGRMQYILDMARPEVVDEIYRQMSAMLDEYDISYIKWDMNRNLTDHGSNSLPAHRQKEHAHRYVLGVYSLMKRLNDNYPNVFFEGCSGGGGRFDYGILYYMPQIWTSDDSDAIERLDIQYGTSYAYPPSAMTAHVSVCPNHQLGRTTPFATRGEVAQMCSFGYELDVGQLSEEDRAQVSEQIRRHRELEDLVNHGDYYRLRNPFGANTCAWELVSQDKKKAYALFTIKLNQVNGKSEYLRLVGLDPDKMYKVKQLDITLSGATLMNAGVPVCYSCDRTIVPDFTAFPFDLEAVE